MLLAAFTAAKLVSLGVFGLFALGAWWLLDMMAASKPRAEDRLEEFANPRAKRRQGVVVKKSQAMTDVLAKASPALAKPLQPKSALEVGKLKSRLTQAGFRHEASPSIFLGLTFAI